MKAEAGRIAQPERNRTKGTLLIAVGLACLLLGFGAVVAMRYAPALGLERPGLMGALIFMGAGTAIAWMGFRIIARGHKLRTVDADHAIAKSDQRPILYLRSFALDKQDNENTITLYGGVSAPVNPWESSIAHGVSHAGPLVAIGRPGEKFAATGAARVYVGDDEWQTKVSELADTAALVVWVYGETEGLKWEISELVGNVPPEKLAIALPFWDVPPKKRGPLWADVVATIGPVLPKPLPETVHDSLFIAFDADWTPIPIKARPPHFLIRTMAFGGWNRVIEGVRALLELRGIPYPKPSVGFLIFAACLSLVWIYLLLMFLVMLYGGFIRSFWEIEAFERLARIVFWMVW